MREKGKKKESGGSVWPTFHPFLCTVGQAMHAEQLESLCNTPPPPSQPYSHAHTPPNTPLLIFQNKRRKFPSLLFSSISAAYDRNNIWCPVSPTLNFVFFHPLSLKAHVKQCIGKKPRDRVVHICSVHWMEHRDTGKAMKTILLKIFLHFFFFKCIFNTF